MKNNFFVKTFLPVMAITMIFAGCGNNQDSNQTNQQNSTEVSQNGAKNTQKGNAQNGKNRTANQGDNRMSPNGMVDGEKLVEGMAKEDLSAEEKAGLIQMREEEKLAHDVYTKLAEKWSQQTFTNIAESEQTHTEAVKVLLDKYEIVDPVTSDEVGKFTSTDMQKLYTDLVTKGETSLAEALKVGATVEDLDIKDLQDLLAKNDNADIKIVYENLMRGSQNHLRAYVRQIEQNGETYSAQYISAEDYQNIIFTEQERGGMNNSGDGQGMKDNRPDGVNGGRPGQGGPRNGSNSNVDSNSSSDSASE